jgi:DNA modification methylase
MHGIESISINQILQTDCVQGMQQLPDCCIPLTVTSPPYDHLQNLRHPDYDRLVAQLYRVSGTSSYARSHFFAPTRLKAR